MSDRHLQKFQEMYSSDDEPFHYSTRAIELYRHDHVLRLVRELSPRSTLEIGCSLGLLTRRLPGNVTAIDLSPNAVRRANGSAAASVLALPFPDKSFDLVLASDGPTSWYLNDHEIATAYAEMARVSKRYVLITEYLRPKAVQPFLQKIETSPLRIKETSYLYNRLWYSMERALPPIQGNKALMHLVLGISRLLGKAAAHHVIVLTNSD